MLLENCCILWIDIEPGTLNHEIWVFKVNILSQNYLYYFRNIFLLVLNEQLLLMTCFLTLNMEILPQVIYNHITAMGFSAMFTFQLDNTKR